MKAMALTAHGGPDTLQRMDLPDPTPRPGEVRVKVKACALNRLDLLVREGWPQLSLAFPHVLGTDLAGTVDAVGEDATDVPLGVNVIVNPGISCGACRECLSGRDHACRGFHLLGQHAHGGYAEYACVPRANLVPMPKNLSFPEAASLPLSFLTAWEMLVNRARVAPGETVLVHSAGGGVGSAAVQIARLCGARVLATVGGTAKVEKAKDLGAEAVIDHHSQDFVAEARRFSERRGIDVVVEHTGGANFGRSLATLAVGGRLVTCGATGGAETALDVRTLFYKRISLLGSTLGSKGDLFTLAKLFEEGRLRPVVDREFPLAEAAKAHGLLADRAHFGKLVLLP